MEDRSGAVRLKLVFSVGNAVDKSVFAETMLIFQIKGEKMYDYVITVLITFFFSTAQKFG